MKTLLTWAGVVLVGVVAYQYGYPVVLAKFHAKEIAAVTADLENVTAGEQSYFKLNGTYAADIDALGIPATISKIRVVSATSSGFCLAGTAVTGGVTRYYSPARGLGELPCG